MPLSSEPQIVSLKHITPMALRLAVAERIGAKLFQSGIPYQLRSIEENDKVTGLEICAGSDAIMGMVDSILSKVTPPTQV
jgi:hypothetical protein